jgi:hypothetical protein
MLTVRATNFSLADVPSGDDATLRSSRQRVEEEPNVHSIGHDHSRDRHYFPHCSMIVALRDERSGALLGSRFTSSQLRPTEPMHTSVQRGAFTSLNERKGGWPWQ